MQISIFFANEKYTTFSVMSIYFLKSQEKKLTKNKQTKQKRIIDFLVYTSFLLLSISQRAPGPVSGTPNKWQLLRGKASAKEGLELSHFAYKPRSLVDRNF